ncbi:hypothetical protein ACOMHN_035264 [Nucella lapillus]
MAPVNLMGPSKGSNCQVNGAQQGLDLSHPLEDQGPFDVIVHKVTDILAKADTGDSAAQTYIHNIQSYVDRHPECVFLDPLEGIRCLLDRYKQYRQVCSCDLICQDDRIIIPKFVELTTSNVEENKVKLADAGVTFPLVVKPILSHGCRLAHEMAIIFSEDCLCDVEAPCVAQSFLNHNALLYKIFVVGSRQFIVQRPSLKNLYPGNQATVFFDTQEVSKPGSSHPLNEIDAGSLEEPLVKPDWALLEQMGAAISDVMAMSLIGIDIIIDCKTQQYAVIDINSFPGFEGVEGFFSHLRDHILQCLRTRPICDNNPPTPTLTPTTTTTPTPSSCQRNKKRAEKTANAVSGGCKASSQSQHSVHPSGGESQRLIDCSVVTPDPSSWSLKGGHVMMRWRKKNRDVGVEEEEEEEGGKEGGKKKEKFLNQLRSNNNNNNKNNNCPSGVHPH